MDYRRELTKQLRQIGRGGDEKQKTARKVLPGLAYSNREIEKQETFAEARAKVRVWSENSRVPSLVACMVGCYFL